MEKGQAALLYVMQFSSDVQAEIRIEITDALMEAGVFVETNLWRTMDGSSADTKEVLDTGKYAGFASETGMAHT